MIEIFLIGSGHGGMIKGEYVTAPKKMYTHSQYDVAYEGVLNRKVVEALMIRVKSYGLPVVDITSTQLDLDLDLRVGITDAYCNEYGKNNVLYIPFHANASPKHNGRGFEIHTSEGDTPSDPLAHLFGRIFKDTFPKIPYRRGYAKGVIQLDKDSPFYELRMTRCPAILPEWSFFDNLNDWNYMKNPENIGKYADMICEFMKQVLTKKM